MQPAADGKASPQMGRQSATSGMKRLYVASQGGLNTPKLLADRQMHPAADAKALFRLQHFGCWVANETPSAWQAQGARARTSIVQSAQSSSPERGAEEFPFASAIYHCVQWPARLRPTRRWANGWTARRQPRWHVLPPTAASHGLADRRDTPPQLEPGVTGPRNAFGSLHHVE